MIDSVYALFCAVPRGVIDDDGDLKTLLYTSIGFAQGYCQAFDIVKSSLDVAWGQVESNSGINVTEVCGSYRLRHFRSKPCS